MNDTPPDWDWRKMNESLLAPDDCRNCSGMGRVPFAADQYGARYGPCPVCKGTRKTPTAPQETQP